MVNPEIVGMADIYASMDAIGGKHFPQLSTAVRTFAAETAYDVIVLTDEEVLLTAGQLDEQAHADAFLAREALYSGSFVYIFARFSQETSINPFAHDKELAESYAIEQVGMMLARRLFKMKYPNRFVVDPDELYRSNTPLILGGNLASMLVAAYSPISKLAESLLATDSNRVRRDKY